MAEPLLAPQAEAKKNYRVVRAHEKLETASMPSRMQQAMIEQAETFKGRGEKRGAANPEWQASHAKRPLGYVPDFDQASSHRAGAQPPELPGS